MAGKKLDFGISIIREGSGRVSCCKSMTLTAEDEKAELARQDGTAELIEFFMPEFGNGTLAGDEPVDILNALNVLGMVGRSEIGDAMWKLVEAAFKLGQKHPADGR